MIEGKRDIPSLDGLRAFSVIAVILGHSQSTFLDRFPGSQCFRNGGQGVTVFFVLSGFLITHLLLKELNRKGSINLKTFYVRRTFRIFAPFYAFLLVIAILSALHFVAATGLQFAAAASYTWNYVPTGEGWILGHSWSLSLEEQFYLLWPACMAYFSKRTNLRIAIAVILLSPVSRLLTYELWPSMRTHIDMMLHTHLDAIMMGALLSLLLDMKLWERTLNLATRAWAPFLALGFLFFVDTPAVIHFRGTYSLLIGFSLRNLAVAILLLYSVFRYDSWLGKVLNLRFIRHIGRISYSLYLWQQLFTGPYTRLFPLNVVWIVLCAELSFYLVERPSLRLRDAFEARWLRPSGIAEGTLLSGSPQHLGR